MIEENLLRTADALRKLALNEQAKAYVMKDPWLTRVARQVTDRYVAGEKLSDAIKRAANISKRGYRTTIDFMGESTRDEEAANEALQEFLNLTQEITTQNLQCTISLDLSHIGSVVNYDLGLKNAAILAEVTNKAGIEMMISME